MDSDRSNQVTAAYKQHKVNVSVMTRIRQLLDQFDANDAADRRWAVIGVAVLIGILAVTMFYFISGATITIA